MQSSFEQAGDTEKVLMVHGVGTNASKLSASN
jgi:hypothetical protein